ncbi:MAG: hypothetical protein Phog2KO_24000 [Phototrophicaceae bacterium]
MYSSQVTTQAVIKVALLFIMVALILKVAAMYAMSVDYDTNYYLNIGSNFIERGELTPYMWRLGADTNIIAGSGTGYGIYLLNFWFKMFGLSLFSGYIFMYALGIIALVVLFFLTKMWWQNTTAAWVGITFASLTTIYINIFYIRMDTPAIVASSSLLLFHIYAVRQDKKWLHFVLGILAILTAEIHIQALLYIGALSFYYFWNHIQVLRQEQRFWKVSPSLMFFMGAFIAGILYLIVHVLPDPEAYFIISKNCFYCSPSSIFKEIRRYLLLIQVYKVEALIIALALGIMILRRSKADKHILLLLTGYAIVQGIISPPAQAIYLTHMLPLMTLVVGGFFIKEETETDKETMSHRQLILITIVASILASGQLVRISEDLAINDGHNYDGIEYIHAYVPHDAVVVGLPPYFSQLIEYPNFLSMSSGENYGIVLRDESYLTFYRREQPQVFIGESANGTNEGFIFYMNENNFQQVRDRVWVAASLLESIQNDAIEPTVSLSVSEAQIRFNDCITLEWAVENAEFVTLNGRNVDTVGAQDVCLLTNTNYTLRAYWVGEFVEEHIRVVVD